MDHHSWLLAWHICEKPITMDEGLFLDSMAWKITLLLLLLALYEYITARKKLKKHVKLRLLFFVKGLHCIKKYAIRFLWPQGFQKYIVYICFHQQNPSYKWLKHWIFMGRTSVLVLHTFLLIDCGGIGIIYLGSFDQYYNIISFKSVFGA